MRNLHHAASTCLGKARAPCGRAGPGSANPVCLGAGQAGVCCPSYSQPEPQAQCFLHSQLGSKICSLPRRRWGPIHTETPSQSSSTPEPGSMQWEQLQPCLSDPSGKSCSTGFAQTVLSCFNQLPPCLILSQPQLPPGTAVPPSAGGDSQGMELGEVPVPALQGQTWAC